MYFYILFSALMFSFIHLTSYCQDVHRTSSMLKISEDNDFININFSGSDKAYTHGFRAEILYTKKSEKSAFAEQLMLKAGAQSINTFGWGIMQTMVTPGDLSKSNIIPSDYRYACSLTILRSRHSSNPLKKYNVQTEYVAGVLGPIALGKQTQAAMHKLIQDEMPRGWDTQFKTSILLNINITAEKQLLSAAINGGQIEKRIEYIGGIKTFVGTSLTAFSFYSFLRVGKMSPYFSGYINQYLQNNKRTGNWQLYAIVRPSIEFVFRNAHVQGGTFRPERTDVNRSGAEFSPDKTQRLNPVGYSLNYGLVLTLKKIGITFTQHDLYAMIKDQTRHEVGNITIYVGL